MTPDTTEMSKEEKKEYYEELGFEEGKIVDEEESQETVTVIDEEEASDKKGKTEDEMEQYREVSGL